MEKKQNKRCGSDSARAVQFWRAGGGWPHRLKRGFLLARAQSADDCRNARYIKLIPEPVRSRSLVLTNISCFATTMATYAQFKHVELYKIGHGKNR